MPFYVYNGTAGSGSNFSYIMNGFPPTACNIPAGTQAGTLWIDTSTTPHTEYIILDAGTGNCDAIFTKLDEPIGCIPKICDTDDDTYITTVAGGGDPDAIEFVNNGVATGHINMGGQWAFGNGLPNTNYQTTIYAGNTGGSFINQNASIPMDCGVAGLNIVRGVAGDYGTILLGNSVGQFAQHANEDVHILSGKCPSDVFLQFRDAGGAVTGPLDDTFTMPTYPETRDDSVYHFPLNFLYTNPSGEKLSSPITNITDNISCLKAKDKTGTCASLCIDCNNLSYVCGGVEVVKVDCSGEVCLKAYPETRDDGCSDSFLTTDASGCMVKKFVKKGWDDMGTISAIPTAITANACKAIYRWKVDTSAGNIDFTPITVLANITHGDTLCFTNMGTNDILYTDPYSGFTYTFSQMDVLTLTYDSTNGYAIEVG